MEYSMVVGDVKNCSCKEKIMGLIQMVGSVECWEEVHAQLKRGVGKRGIVKGPNLLDRC